MKRAILIGLAVGLFAACQQESKVLVFSKTEGFRHKSIETGVECIRRLGAENNFLVDHSEDSKVFLSDSLRQYQAVILLNTTGDIFDDEEQVAFRNYVQEGGAIMGIHSASDTELDWPWFNHLIGAYFDGHPKIQSAEFEVLDHQHASTADLPTHFNLTDEFYNFKSIQENSQVLININEQSYEGGKNGSEHPMTWHRNIEGSRVFYTALGHRQELYQDSLYLSHLLGGIEFVLKRD